MLRCYQCDQGHNDAVALLQHGVLPGALSSGTAAASQELTRYRNAMFNREEAGEERYSTAGCPGLRSCVLMALAMTQSVKPGGRGRGWQERESA